jgi:cell division protein FtsQ
LTIEVGREQPQLSVAARLERFVANYAATVGKISARIEGVDLRYPNGFAAKVPGMRTPAAAQQAPVTKPRKPVGQARPARSST